jgi:hypothetical protein
MVLVMAGSAVALPASAADEPKQPKTEPTSFFARFFSPRMDAGLNGEVEAAKHFTNPAANPWTRDDETVMRIERRAIHGAKSAVKRYAIESLGLDAWSLPLVRGTGTGLAALKTESGGPRLTFGFSHMAPRAEVLVPVNKGRVGFSADVMGRVGVTFEAPASSLRFGAAVDPRDHSATFGLTSRF